MELIVNDLYRLDYLDSLNKLNEQRISLFQHQLVDAHEVIHRQDTIINNTRHIVGLQEAQKSSLKSESDYWRKQYKKQKGKTFIVGGIGVVLVVIIAVL